MRKIYCVICGKYRKFKNTFKHFREKKHTLLLLFDISSRIKMKTYLKKNQLRH